MEFEFTPLCPYKEFDFYRCDPHCCTAMPYVPPHLRGTQGQPAAPPSPRTGPTDYSGGRGGGGATSYGGGFSSRPESGYRAGRDDEFSMHRSDSSSSINRGGYGSMPRNQSSGRLTEPVFLDWKPSERVQALRTEQIVEIRQRLNVTVEVKPGQPEAPPPIEAFQEMSLHPNILTDIAHHKYETPTPIQCQGIPIALSGSDILGCAETGSGKTASFAIPMIHHCLQQKALRPGDGPIALVLAPTRELAQQIEKEIKAFARTSGRAARSCIVVGGVHMAEQRHELKAGVEVVVATPGRFIDHLQQGNTNLDRISFVVLDEADRMLDMGFEPQIKEVMGRLPLRHQTLLFSATMPREIEGLAQAYLNNPITVKVGAVSTPTANVAQSLESCPDVKAKMELLIGLLSKEMELANSGGPPMCLTVVFVERKIRCDEVAEALRYEDIPAVALHGGLTQVGWADPLPPLPRIPLCCASPHAALASLLLVLLLSALPATTLLTPPNHSPCLPLGLLWLSMPTPLFFCPLCNNSVNCSPTPCLTNSSATWTLLGPLTHTPPPPPRHLPATTFPPPSLHPHLHRFPPPLLPAATFPPAPSRQPSSLCVQGEREAALRDFAAGLAKVLVATDVASRGLDIKGIGHVVNMDLPKTFEDYVHRIGRTGRAGTRGRATSFYTERDSFLVTQIKTALSEVAKGNNFAFASGKAARQEERQLAAAFKSGAKLGAAAIVGSGAAALKADDKYAFMAKAAAAAAPASTGIADAAWDD
ncbi:uncharacterized protein HaLaN_16122 [Haematococcus lacustris]|uniref:DEAD box RNA helicase n=1 Tax=Haematococcus lacustris TaxID=44745 RepID=A0A699ZCV3_HAELA|nr:uncharacterized protein HaLaN_16122 [Haematococcus lacustris]